MATIRDGEQIRDARMLDKLYDEYRRLLRPTGDRQQLARARFNGALDLYMATIGESGPIAAVEIRTYLQQRARKHERTARLDAAWKGGGADRGEG